MMWVIIGLTTLVGPVGILALRNVINPRREAEAAGGPASAA